MILVLGATGFLGKRVCKKLEQRGLKYAVSSRSLGTDLEDPAQVRTLFEKVRPSQVLNCSAFVGGIQYGYKHPGQLFARNMKMGLNILDACRDFKTERLINPVSNCAYPGEATFFKESEFWNGPLHESVLAYGGVRKALWIAAWGYAKEYGVNTIHLVLSNMYGPEDHFEESRSHALGALIRKFVDAQRAGVAEVLVWGTGKPVREWLHVDDSAEAMVRALDIAPTTELINVGVGTGVSVKELAEMIAQFAGFTGKLVFDTTKPDGAPYKTVDGSRGEKTLGWKPSKNFEQGVRETVEWYKDHY